MKASLPSINVKSIAKDKQSFKAILEYQSSNDPRKDIFNYAVEKSWILTEMSVTEKNLEDIFRNLTGKKNGDNHE